MDALLNNPTFKRILQLLTGSRALRLEREMRNEELPPERRDELQLQWEEELAACRMARGFALFAATFLLKLVSRRR